VTIRLRITALATAAIFVVLLIAGFAIVRVHERLLTNAVDERLAQAAAPFTRAIAAGSELPPLARPDDDDSVAQLVRDGRVIDAVPSALREPVADAPENGDNQEVGRGKDLRPGEGAYRVLSVDLGDGAVLHLAATLDDVHDSTSALRLALLLAAPLTALVMGALIWWFVGRTLRPVEAIRTQVAAIGGEALDRRVPVSQAGDELSRLARTMNQMLDRLEQSAEQQRRFVADASHELRSPLTRMRAELEVDLTHPDTADPLATHRSALEEVIGLQQLTDDLLSLARARSGAGAVVAAEVDLDELVLAATRRLRAVDRVDLDTTGVDAVRVLGDPTQLARVIGNVLDNAVRHAASSVAVELRSRPDGTAELAVADDGPGIPVEQRERVFVPFTRVDEARTADGGGTGLGLAIARELVISHGGTIAITDAPDGVGTRVEVTLPRNAADG
jgi:signal transduction histidine kinase